MNIRNIQIFGLKAVKPEYKIMGVIAILFVLFIAIFFLTKPKSDSTYLAPTAQVVQENIPGLTSEQEIIQEPITESTEIPETNETQEAEKEFFEYPGECAVDVRRAEDDVNDINEYLVQDQSSLDQIIKERDDKIAALEEQLISLVSQFPELQSNVDNIRSQMVSSVESSYSIKITNLQNKIDQGNKNLEEAKKILEEVRASCEIQ